MLKISVRILIGICLTAGLAHATTESRAAAKFLLFEPSARAAGMGNAYVAIADDANSTYYNPAALADDSTRSVSTTFYKPIPSLASDIFNSFGAYTQSVPGVGNLGFSLIYTSLGEQNRTGENGEDLGTFTSFGVAMGVSYGTELFRSVSMGVTVKLIHQNLTDKGAGIEEGKGVGTTFGGDMGMMWQATDKLTLAWVLRNVGPNITFIDADQADPLPQNLTFGFAYDIYRRGNSKVLFTTDIYKPLANEGFFSFINGWSDGTPEEEFKDVDFHVGAEWQYGLSEDTAFALRAGYSHDEDGKRTHPTFGLGLNHNWASFDLSYFADNSAALRNVFRFSGGFKF